VVFNSGLKTLSFKVSGLSEVFQISIFLSERTLFAGTPFLGLLNVFSEVFQYFSYPNHASTRQPLHVQGEFWWAVLKTIFTEQIFRVPVTFPNLIKNFTLDFHLCRFQFAT
jgi:hypothetical protein